MFVVDKTGSGEDTVSKHVYYSGNACLRVQTSGQPTKRTTVVPGLSIAMIIYSSVIYTETLTCGMGALSSTPSVLHLPLPARDKCITERNYSTVSKIIKNFPQFQYKATRMSKLSELSKTYSS